MAGVSTDFTAHSTRATAVSVAFDKGVSIKDILNTADWSSDSVFKKYYINLFCKPIYIFTCCFASVISYDIVL